MVDRKIPNISDSEFLRLTSEHGSMTRLSKEWGVSSSAISAKRKRILRSGSESMTTEEALHRIKEGLPLPEKYTVEERTQLAELACINSRAIMLNLYVQKVKDQLEAL